MTIKRCIAGLALVLVSSGLVGAAAASHSVAGSEGHWPSPKASVQHF